MELCLIFQRVGEGVQQFISEHCGLLNKLLPRDRVLANRGFDIEDSVGLYAARLKNSKLYKGKAAAVSIRH